MEELFRNPVHPYTRALLEAVPIPDIESRRERTLIKGEVTSPIDPQDACRFAERCEYACEKCSGHCPEVVNIGNDHYVRCFFPVL